MLKELRVEASFLVAESRETRFARNRHPTVISTCLAWWADYITPVYSQCLLHWCSRTFSFLAMSAKIGQGLVWSIPIVRFTIWTDFQFLGSSPNIYVGATCHDDHMFQIQNAVLVPLAIKVHECVNKIGLSLFLEGLSFNPVCFVIARARSAQLNCGGHRLLTLSIWLVSQGGIRVACKSHDAIP